MIEKLNIVGHFRGWSGYDHHTRAFVKEFVRAGVRVHLRHMDGWSVDLEPSQWDAAFFDGLSAPVGAETTLHFTAPDHTCPAPRQRNVNYTMFEANRIPAKWVERAGPQDLIVVPTKSSRDAWVESGVPAEKLRMSPLGVDVAFFSQRVEPLPVLDAAQRPIASYGVRVLNIAELRPRKNHLGLLRVWLRATRHDDDAVLVMKATLFRRRALTQFYVDLRDMLAATGLSFERAAPVCLVTDTVTDEQIRALYQACTHYISLSRGEGWDMPMMEAAISGLRLVAPDHSAYQHYLAPDCAHLIPARLIPAVLTGRTGIEDSLFFQGLSWWEPDEDAAIDVIRRIVRAHVEPPYSPRDRIAQSYSWEQAAHSLLVVLAEGDYTTC